MDLSAEALLASLVVSSVGFGLFLYGKKQQRLPQLLTGIAIMACSYLVQEPVGLFSIAGGLVLVLAGAVRAGA